MKIYSSSNIVDLTVAFAIDADEVIRRDIPFINSGNFLSAYWYTVNVFDIIFCGVLKLSSISIIFHRIEDPCCRGRHCIERKLILC